MTKTLSIGKVAGFVREYHPKWRNDSEAALLYYLQWFAERNLLAISLGRHVAGGEIYGVCAIRLFDELDDFLVPKAFDPHGKFCMVELLVAVSPNAIAECFDILFARWGPQEIMLWDRMEKTENGAPRMFTWAQYLKLTKRLTYGLVDPKGINGNLQNT